MSRKSYSQKIGPGGRSLARTVGRGAIWATLALLLVRGVGSVFSSTDAKVLPPREETASADQAADAFAVRFARAYLAGPSAEGLAPYMAEGAHVGAGLAPKVATAAVAQAEVSHTEDLGGGESVLTVACELRDSRTLYLAVPISRSQTGEVAALGAPWMVAGPGTTAGAGSDRPRPLAGPEAAAIESLISKFLPLYLASGASEELSYLLVPGRVVQPLGGQVALKSLGVVSQLGDDEGPRRTVLAAVRVTDPTGGGTYPLAYRLSVEKAGQGGRWYVAAVEGVSA